MKLNKAKVTKAVEAVKDVTSLARDTVQWQLEERKEMSKLSEEQREELRNVEVLVSEAPMSEWTPGQTTPPAGTETKATNEFFSTLPALNKLVTVGHAVSPHTDNYYLRVQKGYSESKTDVLVLLESKIAQRLFDTLMERARVGGTPLPRHANSLLTDI